MKKLKKLNEIILQTLILLVLISSASMVITAQDDVQELREKVKQLFDQDKIIQAIPYLEQLVIADPDDAEVNFKYGFALYAKAQGTEDTQAAISLRIRARKAFVQAKKLGSREELLDDFLRTLPVDGKVRRFSNNDDAEKFMIQGEREFSSGNYDKAIDLYEKALKLDPKIYFAALFTGDMYLQKKEFDKAEFWYQKAIKIDPTIETAYRYSATPLMRQRKYEEAKLRYVEAFITEPYNSRARSGLIQWGEVTKTGLRHPQFDIPKFESGEDGKAKSTINVDLFGDDKSGLAWIGYTATRSEWLEKKFAKTFPNEKEYRHTLIEEAEALRSVIKIAKETNEKKKVSPQFKTLIELDQKGLLESYILLAIPDQGIAQDHAEYLKNNRDKLRQYVLEYVIEKDKS